MSKKNFIYLKYKITFLLLQKKLFEFKIKIKLNTIINKIIFFKIKKCIVALKQFNLKKC